ncbi:hypothetical protein [Paludisphaera soli]|uniref:hypothetical protein n=1 Tax=Paludisphaera soli TaxID=2712865 RepID=UPI0013ED293B|nr:hypothetical protein [Paludisphaera soli]
MMDGQEPRPAPREELARAVDAWNDRGEASSLEGWLGRELDEPGNPGRLPLAEWAEALGLLARARTSRAGWPRGLDRRLTDFLRMLLRFSRPDGRTAALESDRPAPPAPRAFWRGLAAAFPEPDVARVLDWWFPGRDVEPVPPPLPAWSSPHSALGVLRADWTPRGDLVAFDQREESSAARFEVFGSGVSWLGPRWRTTDAAGDEPTTASKAVPSAWSTSSGADVAEWTFQAGDLRVTRLALMLRGRRAAILADLIEGGSSAVAREMRLTIPEGRTVEALPGTKALRLRPAAPARSAQIIPIGQPAETLGGTGRLTYDDSTREIRLIQATSGGRAWLPLLVSWDHARNKKALVWKSLTVAEQGKACSPETAWAARVSWAKAETFVIYRSLGPAARRSFLGFTTTARFMIGRFTPEGDVDVIASLD